MRVCVCVGAVIYGTFGNRGEKISWSENTYIYFIFSHVNSITITFYLCSYAFCKSWSISWWQILNARLCIFCKWIKKTVLIIPFLVWLDPSYLSISFLPVSSALTRRILCFMRRIYFVAKWTMPYFKKALEIAFYIFTGLVARLCAAKFLWVIKSK